MLVRLRHKRKAAEISIEIISWMQKHTIGDLKEMVTSTEANGGDATSLKRLLTNLESMQNEVINHEVGIESILRDNNQRSPNLADPFSL